MRYALHGLQQEDSSAGRGRICDMRILLVDDHVLFRDALTEVLKQLGDGIRIFCAGTADEARAAAGHYEALDLILLDLCLPGAQGISLLTELRDLLVTVPVVVLSGSERPEDVRATLAAGAAGYIPKTAGAHEMLAALRQIIAGEVYVPPSLLVALSSMQDSVPGSSRIGRELDQRLTGRQLEVLRLQGQGLSNKGIANRLDLTEGTVKLHVSAILRALNAGTGPRP